MKTSVATLCLAFALTVPVYGAEDLRPPTSPEGAFPKKLDGSGVDNFYQLSDSLYSGSKPNGEEGFRFLTKLGVKTILSVDGTAPEVPLAKKYGIGYVHVPIGYDGIKEAQALQIVKTAAEQAGPLYVHCHYGINRGPSAAAIVCIAQHGWTPEQATAWMKKAGTSANCAGLFRDVRNFKAPSSVTLTRTTGTKFSFDTYFGYFVSNKFEPDAAESFVVITDQDQFDKVFGVAFVMGDKSHRLPKDAFKSLMVVTAIKRGNAVVEYKVEGVTETNGVVELRYSTTSKKSDTATFACPLIVSIPKGEYKAVQFVEGKKPVKNIEVGEKPQPEKKALSPEAKAESQQREVYFSGRVQGVGFRQTTSTLAGQFAVSGIVKNLPDGRVQLIVEGQPKEIESFLAAIRKKMSKNISKTEEKTSPATGEFQGFGIRL